MWLIQLDFKAGTIHFMIKLHIKTLEDKLILLRERMCYWPSVLFVKGGDRNNLQITQSEEILQINLTQRFSLAMVLHSIKLLFLGLCGK